MSCIAFLSRFAALAFGGLIGANAAPTYNIIDLGTLGGSSSWGMGINNSGQIVGGAYRNDGFFRAFLYSNGVMTDLLGSRGGDLSEAVAINDAGQVPGRASVIEAFLYSGGAITDLGSLGGNCTTEPRGINNAGQVVGVSCPAGAPSHAFLYSSGAMVDLGTLGGNLSGANGINDSGQVVGGAMTREGIYGAFLFSSGVMTDIGTLGGRGSSANAINNSGQVVGYADRTDGGFAAFLYSDGVMIDLGVPGGWSWANAINNSGQVIGNSFQGPFLYSHGVLMYLNDLVPPNSGWDSIGIRDINDSGQITGFGNHNGESHALLFQPVPEPSSSALIGVLLAVIGWSARRIANHGVPQGIVGLGERT